MGSILSRVFYDNPRHNETSSAGAVVAGKAAAASTTKPTAVAATGSVWEGRLGASPLRRSVEEGADRSRAEAKR
jgi:hypothetical protein